MNNNNNNYYYYYYLLLLLSTKLGKQTREDKYETVKKDKTKQAKPSKFACHMEVKNSYNYNNISTTRKTVKKRKQH